MRRVVPLLALVVIGLTLRMSHAASWAPPPMERLLAWSVVSGIAAVAIVQGATLLAPWWRTVSDRGVILLRGGITAAVLFTLMLAASGAVRWGTVVAGADLRVVPSYGPLTVWPTLQAASVRYPFSLHLSLGHAVLFATTSLLMAATVLRLVHRDAAAGAHTGGLRSLYGVFPLALAPGACPACVPAVFAFGGAALAPFAMVVDDPLGPMVTLMDLAAPVAAFFALAYVSREHCRAGRTGRQVVGLVLVLALLLLPVTAAIGGLPQGDSDRQDAIHGLFTLATIGAVALTMLVLVVLGLFAHRYRARDAEPRTDWRMGTGSRRLLVSGFILVPVAVVFGIGAVSFTVLSLMEELPEERTYVDVMASQFAWRFQHEDGTVRAGELHVQQGETVVLNLTSADVIHSLFLPDLGVKLDAMPGTTTQTWFEARNAGTYSAYCVEWCGVGHPEMRATVVVHPAGETAASEAGGQR